MSENLVKATQALQESIIDVLKSERRDKFAEAERLCRVGHSLLKAVSSRASDFDEKCSADEAYYTVNNQQMYMEPDTMQVRREKTLSTSIAAQSVTDSNRAAAGASEASELKNLMVVVGQLPSGANRDAVQARIDSLLGSIARRVAPPEPVKEVPALQVPLESHEVPTTLLALAQQQAGAQ